MYTLLLRERGVSQYQTPPSLLFYIGGYHVEFWFDVVRSWSWYMLIMGGFSLAFMAKCVLCSGKLWFLSIFIRAWRSSYLWSKISPLSSSNPKQTQSNINVKSNKLRYFTVAFFCLNQQRSINCRTWWFFLPLHDYCDTFSPGGHMELWAFITNVLFYSVTSGTRNIGCCRHGSSFIPSDS